MEEERNNQAHTSEKVFTKQRKKVVIFAAIAIVLAALPITLLLSRQQQDLRQQAAEETSPYCGNEITACVSNYTGQLRYTTSNNCVDSERELTWGDGNNDSPQIHTCVSRYTGSVRGPFAAGVPLSCNTSEYPLIWSQGDIDQSNVITACVSRYTGQVRVPTNRSCTETEQTIVWATNTSEQCVEPTLAPTNTPIPTSRPTNTPVPSTRPSSTPTSTPRPTNTPTPASVCGQQCFSDNDCISTDQTCGTCRAVEGSIEKICTTPIGGQPTPTNTPIPTPDLTSKISGRFVDKDNNLISGNFNNFGGSVTIVNLDTGFTQENIQADTWSSTLQPGRYKLTFGEVDNYTVSFATCSTTFNNQCDPTQSQFISSNTSNTTLDLDENIVYAIKYSTTQTPTSTPVQPTNTPTPTPIPSLTPQPNEGVVVVNLIMPGIGNQVGDNNNPQQNQRIADIEIFDLTNTSVSENSLPAQYQNGIYSGSLALSIPEGNYYAKVRLNNTLQTQIEGVFQLIHNQTTTLQTTTLIPGDLDQNNVLDIRDYNIFYDCIKDGQCTQESRTLSDFNDDGSVGPIDYNILLRSYAIRSGS